MLGDRGVAPRSRRSGLRGPPAHLVTARKLPDALPLWTTNSPPSRPHEAPRRSLCRDAESRLRPMLVQLAVDLVDALIAPCLFGRVFVTQEETTSTSSCGRSCVDARGAEEFAASEDPSRLDRMLRDERGPYPCVRDPWCPVGTPTGQAAHRSRELPPAPGRRTSCERSVRKRRRPARDRGSRFSDRADCTGSPPAAERAGGDLLRARRPRDRRTRS